LLLITGEIVKTLAQEIFTNIENNINVQFKQSNYDMARYEVMQYLNQHHAREGKPYHVRSKFVRFYAYKILRLGMNWGWSNSPHPRPRNNFPVIADEFINGRADIIRSYNTDNGTVKGIFNKIL
jgi:hypothetical protein